MVVRRLFPASPALIAALLFKEQGVDSFAGRFIFYERPFRTLLNKLFERDEGQYEWIQN